MIEEARTCDAVLGLDVGKRSHWACLASRDGEVLMSAQRDHMVACATRDKNRLRSILLESCPAFEALADLSDPHWLAMLEKLGGPWGCIDAGKASFGAVTKGADRERMDAAWRAASASTRPSAYQVAAESPQVRMLARRIREAVEEAGRLDGEDLRRCSPAPRRTPACSRCPGSGPGPPRSWS